MACSAPFVTNSPTVCIISKCSIILNDPLAHHGTNYIFIHKFCNKSKDPFSWKFYGPSFFIFIIVSGVRLSLLSTAATRVEAGSNTSTVNLRVVRGDETGLKEAAP
jgi:hypothetical protein